MNKTNWERVRFYFLIVLILTSIIQVGILWSYQDYGFPINFFSKNTNAELGYDEDAVRSFLDPSRIIISEGSGDPERDEPSRWILSDKKDSDYITFWEDGKQYLKESLTSGQKPAVSDYRGWSSLAISEKSIVYDFNVNMNQSLLRWMLDINSTSAEIPNKIDKVIVSPWENAGILYISDGSRIYSYYLRIDEKKLKEYGKIFDRYSTSEDINIRKYTFLEEFDPNNSSFSKDVLVIVKGGQYSGFKKVSSSVPGIIKEIKEDSASQVNEIASVVLGVEKDGYDRTIDSSSGTIELKTQNKIYKIYSSGNLEYKFLTDAQESDKGELKDALINSYKLLSRIMSLLSEKSEVYLSKVTENKNTYTLSFNYSVEGIPVIITGPGQNQDIVPAITIEANKNGVLECKADIRNFTREKAEELYNVYFENLQTEIYKRIGELNESGAFEISGIGISYSASEASKEEIKPVWALEANNKKYIIPIYSK